MLTLVVCDIVSVSSVVTFESACSASAVITWAPLSCAWFVEAPYTWEADVAFEVYASTCVLPQSDP